MLVHLQANQREITAGDVQRALDSTEMREKLEGWGGEAFDRMLVYATIEKAFFTYAEVLVLLESAGVTVNPDDLDRSLKRLELGFVLGKDGKKFFYRVLLFNRFYNVSIVCITV